MSDEAAALLTRRDAARAFVTEGMPKGVHVWADKPYAYDWEDGMYLMWQDSDPKKTDERKVAEGIARYLEKFGAQPAEVIRKADGLWWLGPIGVDGR